MAEKTPKIRSIDKWPRLLGCVILADMLLDWLLYRHVSPGSITAAVLPVVNTYLLLTSFIGIILTALVSVNLAMKERAFARIHTLNATLLAGTLALCAFWLIGLWLAYR